MRITINEIKKLFSIKAIVLLLLITGIMYKLYIIPREGVRVGRDFINNIHAEMIRKYGISMDEKEYEDFLKGYDEKVKIADEYIQNNSEFRALEIYDYREYDRIARNNGEEKYSNPNLRDLYYEYYYNDNITIFKELGEMENIKITYEVNIFEPFESLYSDNEKAISRHKEIKEGEEIKSLLPYTIFETYDEQFKYLTKLILISVMFLVSPIYLNDKLNKVNYLQYSSKHGRKLFKSKIGATLITTVMATSVQLIIFFAMYLNKTTKIFLNCGISGYYNSPIRSWFDLNFGQYILVTIGAVYMLSIVIGLISMYVSSKSNKYISLIGIQIPILFIVDKMLLKYIVNNATSMYIQFTGFDYITMPKYILPVVYLLLIIIFSVIISKRYKIENKVNID